MRYSLHNLTTALFQTTKQGNKDMRLATKLVAATGLVALTACTTTDMTADGRVTTPREYAPENTITVTPTAVQAPTDGVEGRICVLTELNLGTDFSDAQITAAHRAATTAIDAVIEERLGVDRWSGKYRDQADGFTAMVENALPGTIDEIHFEGDRNRGMAGCNEQGKLLAKRTGEPVHVIGLYGPQGGIIKERHHNAGEYTQYKIGQLVKFKTTGGKVFRP